MFGVLEAAQAAELVLDAIARSDGTRESVLEELQGAEVRNGILGDFRFDRGDITPVELAIFRVTGATPPGEGIFEEYGGPCWTGSSRSPTPWRGDHEDRRQPGRDLRRLPG